MQIMQKFVDIVAIRPLNGGVDATVGQVVGPVQADAACGRWSRSRGFRMARTWCVLRGIIGVPGAMSLPGDL
ncbi:MAG TPA: hypothetical protein VKZ41_13365 [Gemmatimonadales bacterium]|nr:hypothetical protein [Gemmatimonadales bacterium]